MIDNEIIHNFIVQLKIKKHNFVEIDIQSQNFWCFNDILLKIYKFHNLNVNVIDQQNVKTRSQQKLLKLDMIDVNMNLKMSFLQSVNFIIDWSMKKLQWRFSKSAEIRSKILTTNQSTVAAVKEKNNDVAKIERIYNELKVSIKNAIDYDKFEKISKNINLQLFVP